MTLLSNFWAATKGVAVAYLLVMAIFGNLCGLAIWQFYQGSRLVVDYTTGSFYIDGPDKEIPSPEAPAVKKK